MRRWQIAFLVVGTVSAGLHSSASAVGGGQGKVTVQVSADKKSARANTGKPGGIVFPVVHGCTTWTDSSKTPPVKTRSCPSINGGAPFPVADSFPDGQETAVIRPEEPVFLDHGHWYTQRLGYVWIDPAYGAGIRTVAMQGDPGVADLVLDHAVFDPGFSATPANSAANSKLCSLTEITTPYDPSKEHAAQGACDFIYNVSSLDNGRSETAGGTYKAKVRLYWRVIQIRFNSGATESPGNLVLESDSPVRPILVDEIQSLVTCKSIDANGCD
jgi:hypothetical protein